MFINLSNHPLATWSEEQLNAARKFGDLEEIPFPNINPVFTEMEVQALATAYVVNILEHYPVNNLIVHVMGEMTFCYHVVQQLKKANVRCVVSTSERVVEEMDSNRKLSRFSFIQFRQY